MILLGSIIPFYFSLYLHSATTVYLVSTHFEHIVFYVVNASV